MPFQTDRFQSNAFELGGGVAPEVDEARRRLLMGVGRVVFWGWLIKLMLHLRGIDI